MTSTMPNLSSLSRGEPAGAGATTVPRPRSRWKTRVLLPLLILSAVALLLGYAARSTFWSAVDVWVVPVVAKPRGTAEPGEASTNIHGSGPGPVIAQAPGWIEADPYAISVPALIEGVIKDVLVLEGQHVEVGEVVARMVDDDARLAVKRAEAESAERSADVDRAKAAVQAALSRVEEVRDEVRRKRDLVAAGGISEGQFARLEIRLQGMEREAESTRAAVAAAEAGVRTHLVICEQARLMLQRTEIRSPSAGVVMARLVEPGSRVSMSSRPGEGAGGMAGAIVRLYDPAKLQVRVDVPLADVAKIGVGTPAQVSTEALPDKTFKGTVTRIVHEANIQRNTVQVKVAIDEPVPTLKPEMLTRVRFYAPANGATGDAAASTAPGSSEGGLRLIFPAGVLMNVKDDKAQVWLVDQSSARFGAVAIRRDITIIPGSQDSPDSYAEATSGLHAGDRLVIDAPSSLTPNARVRVLGERAGAGPSPAHGDR